jgi:hypothetical protein
MRLSTLCAALLCPAFAFAAPPPPAVAPAASGAQGGEPNVQRSVIEDDRNRVEELRVRGQARSVVVTTKGPLAGSYDIHVGDPSREMSAGADARRGTAGQRMWRVFEF